MTTRSSEQYEFYLALHKTLQEKGIQKKSRYKHRQHSIDWDTVFALAQAGYALGVSQEVAIDAMVEIAQYIGE